MKTKKNSSAISKTQKKILQAAALVFSERGYRGTSVRMICSKANVNVAAVNYYFCSKENLYFEVHRYVFREASSKLSWIVEDPPVITDLDRWCAELKRVSLILLQAAMRNDRNSICQRRLLAQELGQPSRCLPLLLETFYSPLHKYMAKFFQPMLPDLDDCQLRLWVFLVTTPLMSYFRLVPPWETYVVPENLTPDQWIEMTAQHLVDTLRDRLQARRAAE